MIIDDEKFMFDFRSFKYNYENKELIELKQIRKDFDLKNVALQHCDTAYLIRMIDILLEKVEKLENDNQ